VEKKSKKTLDDYYNADLQGDLYRDMSMSDIGESEDPEAMRRAVEKQKKSRGYFERLKSKLDRG
jgi:hypothetical protein